MISTQNSRSTVTVVRKGQTVTLDLDADLTYGVALAEISRMTTNNFAMDLVNSRLRNRSGLSPAQKNWVFVLAQEARNRSKPQAQPTHARTAVGDFAAITSLFRTATEAGLKYPKIRLATADARPIVLKVNGAASKEPGTVNVTNGAKYDDADYRYYGKVYPDGTTTVRDEVVVTLLREFATDPAGTASAYGHRTGNCCFCGLELSDSRSVDSGFGPICADRYGLKGQWNGKRVSTEVEIHTPTRTTLVSTDAYAVAERDAIVAETEFTFANLIDRARRVATTVDATEMV